MIVVMQTSGHLTVELSATLVLMHKNAILHRDVTGVEWISLPFTVDRLFNAEPLGWVAGR